MFLALVMCLSLAAPVVAFDNLDSNMMHTVEIIDVSDSLRIEMRTSTQIKEEKGVIGIQCEQGAENEIGEAFELRQIENGGLVQIVCGTVGGETLTVTNFEDGYVTSVETIKVSDRIVKTTPDESISLGREQPTMGNMPLSIRPGPDYEDFGGDGSFPFAHITYNTSTTVSEARKVDIYSIFVKEDEESYTINGVATDTLSVIAGLFASVATVFFEITSLPGKIAVAIVSALGGSVAGGAIGIYFSEDVAVKALYYKMYGRFSGTSSYELSGIAKQVVTKSSSYYDEWFFDGYTPYNWQDGDELAFLLWSDLFYESYPGVKNYS